MYSVLGSIKKDSLEEMQEIIFFTNGCFSLYAGTQPNSMWKMKDNEIITEALWLPSSLQLQFLEGWLWHTYENKTMHWIFFLFFFFFELIYCPRGLSPIIDVTNVVYYYSEAPVPVSSFLQLPHAPHEAHVSHALNIYNLKNFVLHQMSNC